MCDSTRAAMVVQECVNLIVNHEESKAMTLDDIKTDSKIMQDISECIRRNTWYDFNQSQHADAVKQFKSSKLTRSHASDFVVLGTRLVIPSALKDRVIQLAHEGYQGAVKTPYSEVRCAFQILIAVQKHQYKPVFCVKPIHQLHTLNHSVRSTKNSLGQCSCSHSSLGQSVFHIWDSTCLKNLQ